MISKFKLHFFRIMLINLEQENMQISVVENQRPKFCFKLHHMHLWCLTNVSPLANLTLGVLANP